MPEYEVYLKTRAEAVITVTADDPDAAITAALDDPPTICAQCSGWRKGFSLDLGDWVVAAEPWPASDGYPAVVEEVGE
jgi:hypothetical protein